MASATKRTIKNLEDAGANATDALHEQIAALRKEIDGISRSLNDYGGNALEDLQHNAVSLAKEVRHQGAVVAKQVNRQATVASKAIQDNPVPALVVLGTIALVSALIFTRD